MFVRKKKNRSGTTTIVVVNKRHGKFEEVRNFGTAKTESEVSELYSKAQHWLNTNGGQQSIDFEDLKDYLNDERLSLTQIADLMNFTSLSYFSRYCTKHLGQSPSEYRLSLQPK